MGATTDQLDQIASLYERDLFKMPAAIADIGCQQLYHGTPEKVRSFVNHFNAIDVSDSEIESFAKNGAFITHVLKRVGFSYRSFDIVEAVDCEYFDLNHDKVPRKYRNHFDIVLNFGTTEHVLNQFNALQTLHDFVKPGGFIYSYFIRAGHPEHGLVHYSDRFIDLWMKANRYEEVWRYDHNVPANECSWIIVRKVGDNEFQTPIDVQEGDDLPQLRQRPVGLLKKLFG